VEFQVPGRLRPDVFRHLESELSERYEA